MQAAGEWVTSCSDFSGFVVTVLVVVVWFDLVSNWAYTVRFTT